jgi:hypothetical protein
LNLLSILGESMKHLIYGFFFLLCMPGIFTTKAYAQETLVELHSGCDSVSKSRNSDCVAAMHHYCEKHNLGGAGISQEVGGDAIGVACVKRNWYGSVPLHELTKIVNGCNNIAGSQTGACVAAVHRWCSQSGKGGVGVVQETGKEQGVPVFGVACFAAKTYQDVPLTALQKEHPDCNAVDKSQASSCVSAAHRWCTNNRKGGGGFSQEEGNGVLGIACFDPMAYRAVKIHTGKQCVWNKAGFVLNVTWVRNRDRKVARIDHVPLAQGTCSDDEGYSVILSADGAAIADAFTRGAIAGAATLLGLTGGGAAGAAGGAAVSAMAQAGIPHPENVFYTGTPGSDRYLDVWGTIWNPQTGPGGPIH